MLAGALVLVAGLAHATPEGGTALAALPGGANAAASEAADTTRSTALLEAAGSAHGAPPTPAADRPMGSGEAAPLPRFTVGWYCPAPRANPLPDLLGFGLGLLLIWGMAARRKARDADRA